MGAEVSPIAILDPSSVISWAERSPALGALVSARGPCAWSWARSSMLPASARAAPLLLRAPARASPWWCSFGGSGAASSSPSHLVFPGPDLVRRSGRASRSVLPGRENRFTRWSKRAASWLHEAEKERAPRSGAPSHHSTTFVRRFLSVGRSELRPFPLQSGSRIDSANSG